MSKSERKKVGGGKKNRKHGRNKVKCERYRKEGRREKNKKRRQEKHERQVKKHRQKKLKKLCQIATTI